MSVKQKDSIWRHVNEFGAKDGFTCKFCPAKFKSGGPKTIKYHLAQLGVEGYSNCSGSVPPDVRDEARQAVLKMTAAKSLASASAPSNITDPPNNFVDQLVDGIISLSASFEPFFPSLGSAVYYYVKGYQSFEVIEGDAVILDVVSGSEGRLKTKQFKNILTSFRHTKHLLDTRAEWNAEEFFSDTTAIDQVIDSTKYGEAVKFLVESNDFWDSAQQFVHTLEPLFQILSVVAVDGKSIGHWYRCLHSAKAAYVRNRIAWEEDVPVFYEIYQAASSNVFRSAAYLDPTCIGRPGFVLADAMSCLWEFADQYVHENDRAIFKSQVTLYLNKHPILFTASAEHNQGLFHPVFFWFWYGHGLEKVRKYALPLSFMKCTRVPMTDEELKNLIAGSENIGHKDISQSGLEPFMECQPQVLDTFINQEGTSFGGYIEFWNKLKLANDKCWDLIDAKKYDRFCWKLKRFIE